MFLLGLSFIAGVLTILAPCTLPLLPVIIGGSVSGKPSLGKALIVIVSLGVSLFVFTLILKVSTAFIAIPPQVWQWLSGTLIILFGLVTLFPGLWDHFAPANSLYRSSNKLLGKGYLQKNIWGDVLIGASLGPVFSSCSPTYFLILATVLPVNLTLGLGYLSIYVLGLCLALLLIAFLGQRIVGSLGIASDPRGWFKRALGALFVLVGIAILFGFDKTIENRLAMDGGNFDVTRIEQNLLLAHQNGSVVSTASTTQAQKDAASGTFLTPQQKALIYPKAPELARADAYLNTGGQPISLAQYRGKDVVLIDFWTYSCINCQRTLPYLTAWYQKYKDQGLVIIGVHTPEFAFEHVQANVENALKQFGITYPVVLDNEYQTWNAFGNQFWPREYLIDIDGYIVHDHAGEGEYDQTEKAIQAALAERAARLNMAGSVATGTVSVAPADLSGIGSPETYFGAERNQYLGNGTQFTQGTQSLTLPQNFSPNTLYLDGTWNFASQYATASDGDEIVYRYNAKNVYVVASSDVGASIEVLQDGKPLTTVPVQESKLYTLVQNASAGEHVLKLKVHGSGVQFYTFTFG